jgi:hypothetical protein
MFSALILDLVFCHTEQPFRHLFSFEIGNGFKFYHQYLPYIVQHILRRLPVIVQLTADITEQHMTVFLEYDLKKSFLLLSHTLLSPSCYFAVLLFRARHICNVLRLSKSFVFSVGEIRNYKLESETDRGEDPLAACGRMRGSHGEQ